MDKKSWANWKVLAGGVCGLTLAIMSAGCSHSEDDLGRGRAFTGIYASKPPSFLTSPATVLLTSSNGYSAQVNVQADAIAERDRTASGQLLCQGSKLFFSPANDEKKTRTGGYSFIWDTATQKGYVLSETLQGYAPVGSDARVTNVVARPGGGTPERLDGHNCAAELDTVQFDNGLNAEFAAWRATDFGGVPLRLTAATNAIPLSITLTKLRPENLSAELFLPPDGFTPYSSPEAMSDEIVARQHNLKRKSSGELVPLEPSGVPPVQRY